MDITVQSDRKKLIDKIESNENKGRKSESYRANEVYNDRIKPYVVSQLREQFDESTIREIPIVSSMNICKRVVNALSCIYSDAPERRFNDVTEEQENILWSIYDDCDFNTKLSYANKAFKNHDQCLIQIVPKKGKLAMRVYKPFQYDIIPNQEDPEEADGYIISGYDSKYERLEKADQVGSATGFQAGYKSNAESYTSMQATNDEDDGKVYLIWTKEVNFLCNRKGEVVGDIKDNPLKDFGIMPFVEVSKEKDFQYWVSASNQFSNFTVDFNVSYSLAAQVCKMQGFSQAIIKGPTDMLMERFEIGPNIILKLPMDETAGVNSDFQYANTGGDIMGNIAFIESLLAGFLSSLGIDPKTVSLKGEGTTYTSGLERLLAMIEKVSASKEDYDKFLKIEYKLFELIKAWLTVLSTTETLDRKYWLSSLPESASVTVEYKRPEMVMSRNDQLDVWQKEIDMGINSPVGVLMEKEDLTKEQAEERYREIESENMGVGNASEQPNSI